MGGATEKGGNKAVGEQFEDLGMMGKFRGKTEQEILDYLLSEGLWNGKDDITFFAQRPLNSPFNPFFSFEKSLNINLLHEHAFGIEGKRLVNIGYTGKELNEVVAADSVLDQGDYSSYRFSRTVYQGNMNSAANSVVQSGGWGASDYNLFSHNCQDFTDAMRGTFSQ